MLLLLACTQPCDDLVGLTRDALGERFRDVPGESGAHTLTDRPGRLDVRVDRIPDDAISARDYRIDLAPDADGVARVTRCRVHTTCARGWSIGSCP
jgi:hypothetical protein